ncbi:CoA pyrophosphatase [Prauserella sp. PE36]|uniref:CoA pyrophosphatase n=1 Tax=Prauserella endophytica TaxID=1592324 RepID=A0ABY2S364_9PSEU|nr:MULTISPECIES: CoA pyrophosphatase [Prauserella]PXY34308.1 coenzyme A pyrophosphatase [Prauserella coralliicola]RBM23072.1 CoA pyrophosphatase [Prauserella sp. PE36]TKG70002.1 CoA pyrophosphatase [Prauserella endophytica]
MTGPLVDPGDVPEWLRGLVEVSGELDAKTFTRFAAPSGTRTRSAAVLILFGDGGERGPDVLLLRRADTLGSHAGQVAFPGGGAEDGDDGPVGTALREAEEETGVVPSGVRPLAVLPELYVPVSGFAVTPVLAHWREPCPVHAVDPAETAAVARVPVAELTDPANRFLVRRSGADWKGPAFEVGEMFVWGFTAGLLSVLLTLGGWEREWDHTDVRDLDVALARHEARVRRAEAGSRE